MKDNKLIDHTLLKPDASIEAIEKLCEEAMKYHFASVCVYPYTASSNFAKAKKYWAGHICPP